VERRPVSLQVNPLRSYISTDHDPLFRFHRWLANLRVLEIDEIKSIPNVPVSHPFVERLVGTIRRELLERMCFRMRLTWSESWRRSETITTAFAFTSRLARSHQQNSPVNLVLPVRCLIRTDGSSIVVGFFRRRSPPEWEFAIHRCRLGPARYLPASSVSRGGVCAGTAVHDTVMQPTRTGES
jgi:hypothetical protein